MNEIDIEMPSIVNYFTNWDVGYTSNPPVVVASITRNMNKNNYRVQYMLFINEAGAVECYPGFGNQGFCSSLGYTEIPGAYVLQ